MKLLVQLVGSRIFPNNYLEGVLDCLLICFSYVFIAEQIAKKFRVFGYNNMYMR